MQRGPGAGKMSRETDADDWLGCLARTIRDFEGSHCRRIRDLGFDIGYTYGGNTMESRVWRLTCKWREVSGRGSDVGSCNSRLLQG
jgi:hypothetical protein